MANSLPRLSISGLSSRHSIAKSVKPASRSNCAVRTSVSQFPAPILKNTRGGGHSPSNGKSAVNREPRPENRNYIAPLQSASDSLLVRLSFPSIPLLETGVSKATTYRHTRSLYQRPRIQRAGTQDLYYSVWLKNGERVA